MRIGVDISGIVLARKHVQVVSRFSRQWLASLTKELPNSQFICYYPLSTLFDAAPLMEAENVRLRPLASVDTGWGAAQESMLGSNRDRLDLHIQTVPFDITRSGALPRRSHSSVPLASLLYDFDLLKRPSESLADPRIQRDYDEKLAIVSRYDMLFAVSDSESRDAASRLGVPVERIHPIGCAVHDEFRPPREEERQADAATLAALGVDRPFFVLSIPPCERPEDAWRLIEAVACLPKSVREACQIVFASESPGEALEAEMNRAAACGVKAARVNLTDQTQLRMLYQRSRGVVVTASQEGFGLRAREAMQCGAPVLAAEEPAIGGVGLNATLFFDPRRPLTLTARLAELLHASESTRAELARKDAERVVQSPWPQVAAASARAIQSVVRCSTNGRRNERADALPLPHPSADGLCWVDVSMLMADVFPSGIPRTVACLIAHWPEELKPRLRFFCYQAGVGFQSVDPALAWERANSAAKTGGRPVLKPTEASGARSRGEDRPQSPWREWRRGLKRRWRSIRESLGLRRAALDPSAPPSRPLRSNLLGWTDQDVVFLPGGHFPPEEYFAEIVRQQQGRTTQVCSLIYDLLPEIAPQYFHPQLVDAYQSGLRNTVRTVNHILSISECTRRDLTACCDRLQLRAPKTTVFRLGDELAPVEDGRQDDCRELVERFGKEPFVLCVSHFYRRKNQELLYHVWRRFARETGRPTPNLVFVSGGTYGREDLLDEIFRDPLVRGRVHLLKSISESKLRWLYHHCKFVMYPAIYEGWGLPVAEALAFGKYCIASSSSSIPEVGGDLVDYHDPFDLQACYDLASRALDDDDYVRRREARVVREYRQTSWTESARRAAAALHSGVAAEDRCEGRRVA